MNLSFFSKIIDISPGHCDNFMARFLEYLQNSKRGTVFFFAAFFILVAALYLPLILISDNWPTLDVASRYAPMAEAFARGDFQHAFHPRCQMLHTSVAGVIASVLGCDGFLACKLSSLLFFALSAIPLYSVCRRIWGKKTAYGAVLLFTFCFPVITETAITGLRDPAKMLVQLLLVCGIVQIYQERKNLKGYFCAGAAAGLAVCTREDLALPAVTVLLAAGIFERKESTLILRSVAGVLTALVISALELGANYYASGFATPGCRYYALFCRIFKTAPELPYVILCAVAFLFAYIIGVYVVSCLAKYKCCRITFYAAISCAVAFVFFRGVAGEMKNPKQIWLFVKSVMNGVSMVFFPVAVLGAIIRKLTGQWKSEETVIVWLYILFNMLIIVQILLFHNKLYVSSRYLVTTIPFLLPWCVCFVAFVFRFLHSKLRGTPVNCFSVALTVTAAVVFLYCSYREEIVWRHRTKELRNRSAVEQISGILSTEPKSFYHPDFIMDRYISNIRPRVFFDCPETLTRGAYLGGCSSVADRRQMDIIVTRAVPVRILKKRYPHFKSIRKLGKNIPYGKYHLQVWKMERRQTGSKKLNR